MEISRPQRQCGLPIGAVRMKPQDLQPFRVLLEQVLGEKFRFRGVERIETIETIESTSQPELLVYVPPKVAAALDDHKLDAFLQSKDALYLPGIRKSPLLPRISLSKDTNADTDSCPSFTFVELFAGIGGFRLGLEKINGVSVLASDISPWAAQIYRSYFQDEDADADANCLVEGDMLDLDLKDFPPYTMLTAGFPCQPFSNRGCQQGFDDAKGGQLYLELTRILAQTQPPCFLFENVAQLVLLDGGSRGERKRGVPGVFVMGRVLERILKSFSSCGYQVDWKIVNSRHFLAQNRERVYIVGTRNDLQCDRITWEKVLPANSSSATVRDIMEPWETPSALSSELNPSQWQKVQKGHAQRNTLPSIDGSINLDGKAPTLISQYHRVGSLSTKFLFQQSDGTLCDGAAGNRRPRFLTPRECCRLMGFPEDFPIPQDPAHFYQGIGNAVTPPVIAAIGAELISCIRRSSSSI